MRTDTMLMLNDAYMGAAQTSLILDINKAKQYTIEAVWSNGDAYIAGTIQVQCALIDKASIDQMFAENTSLIPSANWVNVPATTSSISVSAASGAAILNFPDASYRYVRVTWAKSAGVTGVLSIYGSQKIESQSA